MRLNSCNFGKIWRALSVMALCTLLSRSGVGQSGAISTKSISVRPLGSKASATVTAIIGATVIDGTGAPPLVGATIVIRGKRIVSVGPDQRITVPPGATRIDGRGLFVLPGFTDVNVHISAFDQGENGETDTTQLDPQIVNSVRMALRYGVTTLRDSYGVLVPLRMVRDSIRAGRITGARLLIAGNIVGWGGPGSVTMDGPGGHEENKRKKSYLESITQGVGEELVTLSAESLRVRINKYMDKGVDFIKYGGTTHMGLSLPIFSDRAQRAIVEEAHKRGVRVETHATSPEALRSALEAGVDLVQHPEEVGMPDDGSNLSDSLVAMFIRRGVICAINPWDQRVQSVRNDNRKKFIRAGCTMAVASDDREMGEATLKEIRGLVSSGMTPMGALVAATRNGALASGMLDQLGTVEAGKLADLVVLRADPVSDIENVRKDQIAMVFKEGARVDDVLKRDAVYEDYAQSIQRGWAFSSVKGLTLTDKQWSSIEKVKRRYATQMLILIADSLGRGKDSTNNKRRVAELVARQIGASRTILTSAQQAVFDPKAQEWLKLRMAEGCSVTIPGLQP